MTGFLWLWLGYSQIDSLGSFAPIGGVELVTLAIIVSASALAYTIINKAWSVAVIPAVVFSTGFGLRNVDWQRQTLTKQRQWY